DLGAGPAEQPLGDAVHVDDLPVAVRDHHRVRDRLENREVDLRNRSRAPLHLPRVGIATLTGIFSSLARPGASPAGGARTPAHRARGASPRTLPGPLTLLTGPCTKGAPIRPRCRRTQHPMYTIVDRKAFSDVTFLWEVHAPDVARAAQPGHFVMLRLHEGSERIPLTVADYDREKGTITMVIQALGKTTREMMNDYDVGDEFLDFVGPLGLPQHVDKVGHVVLVGGGLGGR